MTRNSHYHMQNFQFWHQARKHIRCLLSLWQFFPRRKLTEYKGSLEYSTPAYFDCAFKWREYSKQAHRNISQCGGEDWKMCISFSHIITNTEGLDGISPLELESFQYSVSPDHNELQRQITPSTNFTTRKIRNIFTVHFNGNARRLPENRWL